MKTYAIMAAIALFGLANVAWAGSGDAAAGKAKSETCAACHGPDGNSAAPNFPKLAGQNQDYMQYVLKQYRDKKRSNAIMNGQAEKLTDKEIADLASYYAQQKGLVIKR